MKPIKLERPDLPHIRQEQASMHTLYYGNSRGWRSFPYLEDAQKALSDELDSRIHSAARDLDLLCKAKLKLMKAMAEAAE